jgi:hypothetical protein
MINEAKESGIDEKQNGITEKGKFGIYANFSFIEKPAAPK